MRRRTVGGLVALATLGLAALAVVATGSAAHKAQAAPIKAAWIYVGPHNDGGWSQAHDAGRLYVQKQLGSKVITTYKENVPEGPQVAQVIDSLVRDGNKIIFATSFGFGDAMFAAAKKYPDVKFEHATGYKSAKNFAEYFGAGEDAIYLSGMAAGAATQDRRDRLRRPVPDPGGDPARERVRARRSGDAPGREGQDRVDEVVVRHGQGEEGGREPRGCRRRRDRPERRQPRRRPVRPVEGDAVGRVRRDAKKFAPTSWLTAAVYNWGPYYLKQVKGAMNGTWKTGSYYGSMADGFTGHRPVRAEGLGQDEGRDRREEEGDHRRQVLRVPGPDLRPERQAAGPEGEEDDAAARSSRWTGSSRESKAARRAEHGMVVGAATTGAHPSCVSRSHELDRAVRLARRPALGEPAVTMRGITKRFPGVLANDQVDFEALVGEVHALLGENGAGKSTLSNIFTGLYRADEGELEVYGQPVDFQSPRDALDAGIGMVHQHFRLVEPFTVAENVMLGDTATSGGRSGSIRARSRSGWPSSASATGSPSIRGRGSGSSRSASSSAWRSSRRSTARHAS